MPHPSATDDDAPLLLYHRYSDRTLGVPTSDTAYSSTQDRGMVAGISMMKILRHPAVSMAMPSLARWM
jgi:hypothetical protein